MKTKIRTVAPRPAIPAKWRWHYRTLLTLRNHFAGGTGDRLRESVDAMEPPSLHAEDLADELYDREMMRDLPANPVEAWREVDAAIHRIETGTYGKCEISGRPIEKSVLRAKPWRRCSPDAVAVPDNR